MHDTPIFREGGVDFTTGINIEDNHEVNIIVTVRIFEILFFDLTLVWSDKDFDIITFNLIDKVVSFRLIEGDDKILQATNVFLEGFFRAQKFKRVWSLAGVNSRDMFFLLV